MIVGVAFYNPETEMLVTMPKPNRHNDIISNLHAISGKQVGHPWVQGFVNDIGLFFNRQQAARYVVDNNQPLHRFAKEEYENLKLTTLFSEDLW